MLYIFMPLHTAIRGTVLDFGAVYQSYFLKKASSESHIQQNILTTSPVMELTIRLLGGVVKSLEVSGDATVGELKQRISQLFGEPPYKQKLSADNGTRISLEDDSRTLSSYRLHSGSVVSLLVTNPGPFQVFVRNEKGQTGTYDVDINETVDQLQTKIYNKERVPKDQQRLIYNGRQLEPGRKLQEYDITPLSTIQMTLRLRGG